MSYDELDKRVAALEKQMEIEIEELIKRYQAKRQPILDAIDAKKKRQQNFWRNYVLILCSVQTFSSVILEKYKYYNVLGTVGAESVEEGW